MKRKNLRVGDIVVVTGARYAECKGSIGKIGRIIRFIKANSYDEDYCEVYEDSVVIEALYGEFNVLFDDNTAGFSTECAPFESNIKLIAQGE